MERQELSPSSGYSLSYLSKSRGTVMGLATLLVVCLHVYQIFGLAESRFVVVKEIFLYNCEYGVDLFLLVSGFGLYCSLSKGTDIRSYLIRRALRIWPEYLMTVLLLLTPVMQFTFSDVIFQILGIKLFIFQDITLWYVTFITILYLVYPLVHRIVDKDPKNIWLMLGAYLIFDIVIMHIFGDRIGLLQIVSDRVPVFLVGVLAGKEYKGKNRPISSIVCLVLVFLGVIAFTSFVFLDHYAHFRLGFMFMAVAAAVVTSLITVKLGPKNPIIRIMEFIGCMSLQVYLVHGLLTKVIVEKTPLLNIRNKTVWIVVTLIGTFLAAFILKTVCDAIRKVLNRAK